MDQDSRVIPARCACGANIKHVRSALNSFDWLSPLCEIHRGFTRQTAQIRGRLHGHKVTIRRIVAGTAVSDQAARELVRDVRSIAALALALLRSRCDVALALVDEPESDAALWAVFEDRDLQKMKKRVEKIVRGAHAVSHLVIPVPNDLASLLLLMRDMEEHNQPFPFPGGADGYVN